jgi:hypothetical protein
MGFSNPLKLTHDPFARGAPSPIGNPVASAFADLMREIGLGTAVIVVAGPSGSGKTLLLDMTERANRERAPFVRRIERGDLAHTVLGERCDLLLVDEADSIDQTTLRILLSNEDPKRPGVIVFACRPSGTARFVGDGSRVHIMLTMLTPPDARKFVVERASAAGRPDLFEQGALDALIASTGGSPRLLQSIGGHALFFAAHEGAYHVGHKHVEHALAAQLGVQTWQAEADSEIVENSSSPPSVTMGPKEPEEPALIPTASVTEGANAEAELPIDRSGFWHRFGNRRALAASMAVLGMILSLLFLNGNVGGHVTTTPLRAQKVLDSGLSPTDTLRAMEKVAKAELPRQIVLAIIAPAPLQPLEIDGQSTRAVGTKSPVNPVQATTKAKLRIQPVTSQSPTLTKTGAFSTEDSSKGGDLQAQPPPSNPSSSESAVETNPASDRSISERGPSAEFPRIPNGTSANYLSSDQASRMVFDIAARAGLDYDREYPPFKRCVLAQVSTQIVEAEKFWNAVRRCAQ